MAPFEKEEQSSKSATQKKKKNKKRGKPRPILKFVPVQKNPETRGIKKKHKKPQKPTKNKPKDSNFSSIAESLKVISAYHTLNKKLAQNACDSSISDTQRHLNEKLIKQDQAAMGGLERYQAASLFGASSSKFVCADWVEPLLRLHLAPNEDLGRRPRILDVGAIDNQYLKFDWFDTVAIDLNAQHPSVVKADFFEFAHEHCVASNEAFDAVVMSLVINFQGDPRRRGDMLALAADRRLLKPGGLVFIALPSASLDNSRYCTEEHFVKICAKLRLRSIEVKRSAKLTLLTFRSESEEEERLLYKVNTRTFDYGDAEVGREVLKSGVDWNNFCVLLKSRNK